MGFQIKNFVSIVAGMINRMKVTQTTITDFNIGAVGRTMIEAPAIEIDQLYQQMFNGLTAAIPVATYNSFNFPALPAIASSGLVTVNITAQAGATLIPAGSTLAPQQNAATSYVTQADLTIAAGNTTGTVLAAASTPGALGNIPASTQFNLAPAPQGFVSASNVAAFSNGTDAETPAQQAARFGQFVQTLQRGTVAAITYGLSTASLTDVNGLVTERVATGSIIEPWVTDNTQPVGLVNCYVHNGVGNTSSQLVAQAIQVIQGYTDAKGNKIPGWKAAGVKVTIAAATEVPISVGGAIVVSSGLVEATQAGLANAAVSNYMLGLGIGGTFEVAQVYKIVMAVPGVTNFTPAPVTPPAAPGVSSAVAGALGAATYYVKTTYVNAKGETIASAESSLAVAANSVPVVQSPALTAATGWNVYISTASGTETKQNTAPIALGASFQLPTSGLVAGAAVPTTNTAALTDFVSSQSQKIMPGTPGIA